MAVTLLNNVINPQVMGDMIGAKIEAQLKATKYAHVECANQGTFIRQRKKGYGETARRSCSSQRTFL